MFSSGSEHVNEEEVEEGEHSDAGEESPLVERYGALGWAQ